LCHSLSCSNTTTRPKIKPSALLKPPPADPKNSTGKRPGSAKRKKTKDIHIDHDEIIVPSNLPAGATLEGYRDFAPQFKLLGFVHGLCWVHGERKIDRLIPLTDRQRTAQKLAQSSFWEIYESLKAYRQVPNEAASESIQAQFKQLCTGKTGYPDLNDALQLLYAKRAEFLAVLEHPQLPLHNNLSENDIAEKGSGGNSNSRFAERLADFLVHHSQRQNGKSCWSG